MFKTCFLENHLENFEKCMRYVFIRINGNGISTYADYCQLFTHLFIFNSVVRSLLFVKKNVSIKKKKTHFLSSTPSSSYFYTSFCQTQNETASDENKINSIKCVRFFMRCKVQLTAL